MLIRDGKEYRNLQQQVAENTDDIAELKQGITVDAYTKEESDAKFATKTELTNKQDTLVSGTNIKTINNQSLLGEGNITIGGGGSSYTAGTGISIDSSNVISVDNTVIPYKTDLATVATSGSYNDLSNKPDLSVYETKAEAFSGSYNDLTNKPTIPHAVAAGTGLSLTVGTSLDTMSVDSTYVPAQIENQLTLSSNDKVTGICGYNIASSGVSIHYLKLTQTDFEVYCTLITNDGTQFNATTLKNYLSTNSLRVPATGIGNNDVDNLHIAYIEASAGLMPGTTVLAVGLIDSTEITSFVPADTFTVTDTVIAI